VGPPRPAAHRLFADGEPAVRPTTRIAGSACQPRRRPVVDSLPVAQPAKRREAGSRASDRTSPLEEGVSASAALQHRSERVAVVDGRLSFEPSATTCRVSRWPDSCGCRASSTHAHQRDRLGNERCVGSHPDLGGLFASWRRQMSVFIRVGLVGARRSAGSEILFPTGKEIFDVEDVQGTLNIGQSTHSLNGVPPPTAPGLVRQ
jgi:hypothetical protein